MPTGLTPKQLDEDKLFQKIMKLITKGGQKLARRVGNKLHYLKNRDRILKRAKLNYKKKKYVTK